MNQIIWFVLFILSIGFVYETVGIHGLNRMFPEGKRWWHWPIQLLALFLFVIVVLNHPK